MNLKIEREMAASLAKTLTAMCVRNTVLEDIHSGKVPVTKTGDYFSRFTANWDEPKPEIDPALD